MSSRTLRFEILQGSEVVKTEELDQDVIKVGKLSSSHLRLDDPNVSRIHAVIERAADGGFSVIDLGSATGTYVNDEKVTKAAISAGDVLRFGDTSIRVSMIDASAVQAAQDPFVGVSATATASETATSATGIQTDDGSVVEPYTMQGYYDDAGNYIPGYYDEAGQYHLGYGYYDEAGAWQVSAGYYNPEGEWVATDSAVAVVGALESDYESDWIFKGTRDTDVYQEAFFSDRGGDTLEIAMLWEDNVLSVVSFNSPKTVTIGGQIARGKNANDFVLDDPAIPDERFPLVSYTGGGYALNFTADMAGLIREGDQEYTLADAIQRGVAQRSAESAQAYSIPLTSRTRARVDIGSTTFLVHFTDVPAVILGGRGFDTTPVPYITLSAVAHILFVILAMTMPDNAGRLNLDGFQATDRFVQLMLEPDQEVIEKPDWLDDQGNEEAAAKHKGEEGQAGKEDAPDANKKMAIKGDRSPEDLELKKARDTEIAMSAGIASELMVSSPWGSSDTSIGSDAIHALGGMEGAEFGESKGFGGLGLHGAGRGGGGISERGLGLANVGTAGRGGGGRGGSGYGKGAGDLGERNSRVPNIVPGNPNVQGSLDKEIIRRVVRQNRGAIKYCYEQELQKNKGLAGRVTVRFTISATGSVVSAVVSDSTLNNAAVERCMTNNIRRWVFPEPKGGGIVIVNYPFNLSS